jgi:hypothetical protein
MRPRNTPRKYPRCTSSDSFLELHNHLETVLDTCDTLTISGLRKWLPSFATVLAKKLIQMCRDYSTDWQPHLPLPKVIETPFYAYEFRTRNDSPLVLNVLNYQLGQFLSHHLSDPHAISRMVVLEPRITNRRSRTVSEWVDFHSSCIQNMHGIDLHSQLAEWARQIQTTEFKVIERQYRRQMYLQSIYDQVLHHWIAPAFVSGHMSIHWNAPASMSGDMSIDTRAPTIVAANDSVIHVYPTRPAPLQHRFASLEIHMKTNEIKLYTSSDRVKKTHPPLPTQDLLSIGVTMEVLHTLLPKDLLPVCFGYLLSVDSWLTTEHVPSQTRKRKAQETRSDQHSTPQTPSREPANVSKKPRSDPLPLPRPPSRLRRSPRTRKQTGLPTFSFGA